jgi:hypothetical protein
MLTAETAMRGPAHYLLEFGDHPIQKPQPGAAGRGRRLHRLFPHLVEQAQNDYTTIAGARFNNGILVERTCGSSGCCG